MRRTSMDGYPGMAQAYVTAPLQYMIPMTEKPRSYALGPPAGVPVRTSRYAEHTLPIRDGRAALPELSLDRQGFTLQRPVSTGRNFYDEAELRAVSFPEIERLVAAVTGAVKVLVFDHNLRSSAVVGDDANGV